MQAKLRFWPPVRPVLLSRLLRPRVVGPWAMGTALLFAGTGLAQAPATGGSSPGRPAPPALLPPPMLAPTTPPAPSPTTPPVPGRLIVTDITIQGNRNSTTEGIKNLMQTRIGSEFIPERLQEDCRRL